MFCVEQTWGLKLHMSTATQANRPSIAGTEKIESISRRRRFLHSNDENLKFLSALELWEY